MCSHISLRTRYRTSWSLICFLSSHLRRLHRLCGDGSPRSYVSYDFFLRSVFLIPCSIQALGIDALHNMGVIHRDIKPENIFLVPGTSQAYVRIGDFTNAWVHDDPSEPLKWWKTYSKRYIGTKEYLAPEIYRREWYSLTVDWWALGCLLYDLLVGDVRHSRLRPTSRNGTGTDDSHPF